MTKLPPTVVNYRWEKRQQLTTAGFYSSFLNSLRYGIHLLLASEFIIIHYDCLMQNYKVFVSSNLPIMPTFPSKDDKT